MNKRGQAIAKQLPFFPGVFAKRQKGQVSIEFILLIVITLVYIYGTVWPLINDATVAAEDVQRVSDTKISAQKLANALNEAAANSGESKKTIHLLVPNKASISCSGNQINFTVDVNKMNEKRPKPRGCEEIGSPPYFECSASIALLQTAVPSNCASLKIQGPLPPFKAYAITRDSAGVIKVE